MISAETINALPDPLRQYIHDLETRCDPAGDIQTIAYLREDRDALAKRVDELLESNNAELERRRQAERERDNMRATWERAWAQPTSEEYQHRIRGLLCLLGKYATFRSVAENYILRLRQIVYSGVDSIKAQAGIEITSMDLAGRLEKARFALGPERKQQPFEYDAEPEASRG